MEVRLSKQAKKYLDSVDAKTFKKLQKAIEDLSQLRGDIVKLKGTQGTYRFKIDHYRIIFERKKDTLYLFVIEINTRTNIKY